MNKEEQRMAIAQECGWHGFITYDYSGENYAAWPDHIAEKVRASRYNGTMAYPPGTKGLVEDMRKAMMSAPANCAFQFIRFDGQKEPELKPLPNYPDDLNAMHEAEKSLNDTQYLEYCDTIRKIRDGRGYPVTWRQVHSSADQRAEAFLRTVGRWVEEKVGG